MKNEKMKNKRIHHAGKQAGRPTSPALLSIHVFDNNIQHKAFIIISANELHNASCIKYMQASM